MEASPGSITIMDVEGSLLGKYSRWDIDHEGGETCYNLPRHETVRATLAKRKVNCRDVSGMCANTEGGNEGEDVYVLMG